MVHEIVVLGCYFIFNSRFVYLDFLRHLIITRLISESLLLCLFCRRLLPLEIQSLLKSGQLFEEGYLVKDKGITLQLSIGT